MKGKNKMKKWIDEIAADFVNDLIKKSKQPTDMLKAQEVHDYIGSKTSEELAIEMNINAKDWNLDRAWQYAEQAAYSMVCRAFQKELGL